MVNSISFTANRIPIKVAQNIDSKLMNSKSIDIYCHASTDEDAFNSAKTMYTYLKDSGKSVRIIASDCKDLYECKPKKYLIKNFNDAKTNHAETALCVDFSNLKRIPQQAQELLSKYKNILGLDHHVEENCISKNNIQITDSFKKVPEELNQPKDYYIDSSAKSCCSIIFRFFEALKKPINKEQNNALYCGMLDDMNKSNLIKYGENYGEALNKLPNTKEVFEKVSKKILKNDDKKIIKHLDVLNNLTKKEKLLQKKLFENVKISDNKNFAYVVISPDNKLWKKLGDDSKRNSILLRDFRLGVLENNHKFIKDKNKYKDIKTVAVFYNNSEEKKYKISLHSKENYAGKIIEKVKESYPELIAGGHQNRAGGNISTTDKKECQKWINKFIKAAEELN